MTGMTGVAQVENEEIIVVGDRVDLVVREGQVYRALIEDRLSDGPFLVAVPSLKGIPMHAEQNDELYLVFYRESGRYIAQMQIIGLEKRGEIRYMWLLQRTQAQRNQRREAFRLPVSFNVQILELGDDDGTSIAFKPNAASVTAAMPVTAATPVTADAPEPGIAPGYTQATASAGTQRPAGRLNLGGSSRPGSAQKPAGADSGARAMLLETADGKDISVSGIALITKKQYTQGDTYMLSMKISGEPINPRIPRSIYESQMMKLVATVRRSIPWRVSGRYNTGMQFIGMSREVSEELSQFVLAEQQRQIRMRRLSR